MKSRQFWITLGTGAVLALTSVAALAQDRTVNCDVGQSLQEAVNKARSSAAPLVLNVKGTCYERVRFSRDLLIIDGGNEAVIHGSLISWGSRVTVRNIGITGPGVGMSTSTGRARLLNVHFFDNDEEGLVVSGNGVAFFRGGSIRNSGLEGVAVESGTFEANDVEISGNSAGIEAAMARIALENTDVVNNTGRGIVAVSNSALRVADGAISGNDGTGVLVDNNSSFVADRVDISWNGSSGVGVRYNSDAGIAASTVSNNGQGGGFGSGVFVSTSSTLTIDDTAIFENLTGVNVHRQSFANLRGTTVVRDNLDNGMMLVHDSGAIVDNPVNIPPNGSGFAVYCNDTESSLENRSPNVGLSNCKDFDLP